MNEKLIQLQQRFSKQLTQRVQTIRTLWEELKANPEEDEAKKEFYRMVHSLAGAAGTFGYHDVGIQAKEIEKILTNDEDVIDLNEKMLAKMDELLKSLVAASKSAPKTIEIAGDFSSQENKTVVKFDDDTILIYILEDDAVQAEDLANNLQHFGYTTRYFKTTEDIVAAHSSVPASALILDVILPEGSLQGTRTAEILKTESIVDVPIIFVSSRIDWKAKLLALRAGGAAYFAKPLDYTELVEYLDYLVERKVENPVRVMIVDDMVVLSERYAAVLEQAGMEVMTLNKPEEILDSISVFSPDIILMDLYMPKCTGVEAATIIRQDPVLRSLPIVFLSTESAVNKQLEALRHGGDDFLQKPIEDSVLIKSVKNRVSRFRELKKLMTRDSLTGLLNSINLKLALERQLSLVEREKNTLSYVMIDIDKFKLVNDTYGHPIGDRVIKSLSRLILQRIRKTDIAGRYGGEEFGVILPNTSKEDALKIVNKLREEFSSLSFKAEDNVFSATFSAGVADSSDFTDPESLIAAADAALYQAKQSGRNRVMIAEARKSPASQD